MGWTHVGANGGMGIEEQWLFRPDAAPLCALKRGVDGWEASLLNLTRVSVAVLHMSEWTLLEQAKVACESELRRMGWRWR